MLLLADVAPAHLLWGWLNMVRGPGALQGTAGLRFAKVLGSGFDGGFGVRPSKSRQGLFAVFGDPAAADGFADHSALVARYRERCSELCIVKLRAWSSRGTWDGHRLNSGAPAPVAGPIAALTRASIALRKAPAFWRYAPAAQLALESAPGCHLAVGLGEAPFLRQATFSIWDNVVAMDAYARSGAHQNAIQAAQANRYFSESLFARFLIVSLQGRWKGRTYPLAAEPLDGHS